MWCYSSLQATENSDSSPVTIFFHADLTKSVPSTPQANQGFCISLGFQSLDPFLYHLLLFTVEYDTAITNSFPAVLSFCSSFLSIVQTK